MVYRIRVGAELGSEWSERLAGMAVRIEPDGRTLLTGRLPDQAALHGVLAMIRDLGLPLLSLETVPDGEAGREGGV